MWRYKETATTERPSVSKGNNSKRTIRTELSGEHIRFWEYFKINERELKLKISMNERTINRASLNKIRGNQILRQLKS